MRHRAIQAGLWWLAATGTLMGTAAWIGASEFGLPAFDREGLILANAWRGPWLDLVFLTLTWLGSLMVLLPLALATGILLWRRGNHIEAGFVILALAGASALARLAKHFSQRPRPDLFAALTPAGSSLSFPSAHAVQVTAFAAASLLVGSRLTLNRGRRIMPAVFLIVALVDFSRVYLQVHYPSDVLAGTLAAACWVAGLRAAMFTLEGQGQT
ncbi:MAG: phosphatase PAP2 family protein [Rhodocyclales bacterium]|nr:phosphatase PAP2 family protein [Rhodocyclales bacterium]